MVQRALPKRVVYKKGEARPVYAKGLDESSYVQEVRNPRTYKKYQKEYYENNREERKAYFQDYYKKNKNKFNTRIKR